MMRSFFLFELRLQLRSSVLWATVLFFSLMGFFSDYTINLDGALGASHMNAPALVMQKVAIFTLVSMFFVTLLIAQPLLRDHELGSAELFFSKPMRKRDYVLGRFAAGLALCLAMFAGVLLLMAMGAHMPWIDAKHAGPTSAQAFWLAWAVIVVPNVLFIAGVLGLLATVTRSILMVYVGVVGFVAMWGASQSLSSQLDNLPLVAMLDPFGMEALSVTTRYWLVADFNTRLPELSGLLLTNRLLWAVAGVAMLALAVFSFKPLRSGTGGAWFARKARAPSATAPADAAAATPRAVAAPKRTGAGPRAGISTMFQQFLHLAWFDTVGIVRAPAYLAFLLMGAALYWANLVGGLEVWGTTQYPVTSWMLTIATRGMGLFLVLIAVFYAGELIGRERATKMHEVTDACPTPNFLPVFAKCAALIHAMLLCIASMAVTGMLFQAVHGYTEFEISVYAAGLVLALLPFVVLACLALALQVYLQNKYAALLVVVVLIALRMSAGALGLDDHLWLFGTAPTLTYSDMNGFGNQLTPYLAFEGYWLLLCMVLLCGAAAAWVRGTPPAFKPRLRAAAHALRGPLGGTALVSGVAFAALGSWLFYNTHVQNTYLSGKLRVALKETYEKTYAGTAGMAQPKITAIDVALDLSPKADTLSATVRYQVTNPHAAPISDVQLLVDPRLALAAPAFATVKQHDERFGLHMLHLQQPLAPGESANWEFVLSPANKGFANQGSMSLLLNNGSFVHSSSLLPSFGYNRDGQILDPAERAKRGLAELPAMATLEDVAARNVPFNSGNGLDASDDADWIRFNTVVSTDADQIALAPGRLQKDWHANGRHYFQYTMDGKMLAYAAWLSGRWERHSDQWQGVPIEVYSDPKHGYNVQRMISASKSSLAYFNAAFGPYPYPQLRIVEFPRTVGFFAEAFAGLVPYAEHLGFIADQRDEDRFDMVTYVTAHEVAHQWWGHQVVSANVQGATMVAESLAQYSALMVMQNLYGRPKMRQFLRRELDNYLRGRGRDVLAEQPLYRVQDQTHIHYNKGALAFYRLSEEMGEAQLNLALKKFVAATAFQGPPYATSAQLLDFIRAEAGPQHAQLITELFESITLYDNGVDEAYAVKRADGRYDVTFTVHAAKVAVDAKGVEHAAPLDDWIELGIFARAKGASERSEKVLLLQRQRMHSGVQTLHFTVDEKPYEVGIDPYNKLIDRVADDNRMRVTLY